MNKGMKRSRNDVIRIQDPRRCIFSGCLSQMCEEDEGSSLRIAGSSVRIRTGCLPNTAVHSGGVAAALHTSSESASRRSIPSTCERLGIASLRGVQYIARNVSCVIHIVWSVFLSD